MRKACKAFTHLSLALSLLVTCAAFARAQSRDSRLVSARAGAVNSVTGDVTVRRAGRTTWESLLRTDDLRNGDAARTGANSRAEILLNPGSYLRLGANTEFELTDSSLNTLRLKLMRGSAVIEASVPEVEAKRVGAPATPTNASVIEAAATSSPSFVILIDTPQTQALIIRSGIYRLNVGSETEVVVRDGRALVGRDAALIKGGKSATIAQGGTVEVAKLDKSQKDDLDAWSKQRAEQIARVNNRLSARALNTAFANVGWDNFGWGFRPTGLWYWDTFGSSYTYIPFYSCRSPYGFYYGISAPGLAYSCHCRPGFVGRPPAPAVPHDSSIVTNNGGSIVTGGGGGMTGGGGGGIVTGGGSTIGGGGGMSTRPNADIMPSSSMERSGGASSHRIDPPMRDQ